MFRVEPYYEYIKQPLAPRRRNCNASPQDPNCQIGHGALSPVITGGACDSIWDHFTTGLRHATLDQEMDEVRNMLYGTEAASSRGRFRLSKIFLRPPEKIVSATHECPLVPEADQRQCIRKCRYNPLKQDNCSASRLPGCFLEPSFQKSSTLSRLHVLLSPDSWPLSNLAS